MSAGFGPRSSPDCASARCRAETADNPQPLNNPLIAKHPLASSGRFAELETVVRSGGLSPSLQTES